MVGDFFRCMLLLFFLIMIISRRIEGFKDDDCNVSKCDENGPPIRFPFRLEPTQPKHCGYPGFELYCNHMNQTVLQLQVGFEVVVIEIDYIYQSILLHDPHNCFPAHFPSLNLSASRFYNNDRNYASFALFNCSPTERTNSISHILVPCLSGPGYKVYAGSLGILGAGLTFCVKISNGSSIPLPFLNNQSQGRLEWDEPNCHKCEQKNKMCRWMNSNTTDIAGREPNVLECVQMPGASKKFRLTDAAKKRLLFASGALLLSLAFIALCLIYYSQKRKKEDQLKVERFLKDYRELKPTRYSFVDIKRITNNFKDKLGKGSYGTVFKGKLTSEIFVAIKVLESSMENGAEFINEVGTMAMIHHINVVHLIGFCAEGIFRALVYEFLPNESLGKFTNISETQKNTTFLGWEKLQDIALGIAKGIEYLHEGCDHQILHFDIKPHNILLDQNFIPKVADFGLAKLCPKNQSKVSMTNARGTMGYIAPEVYSRNFGNVSYKSDVYSFGMLLLEIVGGRRNVDPTIQNTSQAYFPEWIYDRLRGGEELGIETEVEEQAQIVKKLTIVGLCCIQWSPIDRPPMNNVVQMLEGNGDALPMPPNPFASIGRYNHTDKPVTDTRALDVISEE